MTLLKIQTLILESLRTIVLCTDKWTLPKSIIHREISKWWGGGGGGLKDTLLQLFPCFFLSKQPALCLYRVLRMCSLSINVDTKLLFFFVFVSVFRIRPCGTIFSNVDFVRCRLSAPNVKIPQMYLRDLVFDTVNILFFERFNL